MHDQEQDTREKSVHPTELPASPSVFPQLPESCGEAAEMFFQQGLDVVPTLPTTKQTAVKWSPWLELLNATAIKKYWNLHPDHELGFIVRDRTVVFDADSKQGVNALYEMEAAHSIRPFMIVKTKKGEHHYFIRPADVFVKSDSHSTAQFPSRIDVKTGRTLVILPPSSNKTLVAWDVGALKGSESLASSATQAFIDAIFAANGRQPPRPTVVRVTQKSTVHSENIRLIRHVLPYVPADCSYDDWSHVGMAIANVTGGSDAGLDLFIEYSLRGTEHPSVSVLEKKYRGFWTERKGFAMGTLFHLAKKNGFSHKQIMDTFEPFDEVSDDE